MPKRTLFAISNGIKSGGYDPYFLLTLFFCIRQANLIRNPILRPADIRFPLMIATENPLGGDLIQPSVGPLSFSAGSEQLHLRLSIPSLSEDQRQAKQSEFEKPVIETEHEKLAKEGNKDAGGGRIGRELSFHAYLMAL
jgi:hypothetical protein